MPDALLPALGLACFGGGCALGLRRAGMDWLRSIALGWILASVTGATLVALSILLASRVDLAAPSFAAIAVAVLLVSIRKGRATHPTPRTRPERRHLGQALVLGFSIVLIVQGQLRIAERDLAGDELLIWTGKALAIARTKSLGTPLAEELRTTTKPTRIHHKDYPHLNPLLLIFGGVRWDDAGPKADRETRWPIQALDLALLLYLAGAIFTHRRRRWLPIFVLPAPFLTLWFHFPVAESDRLVGLGLLLAVDGLLQVNASKKRQAELVFGLGLLLLVSSKNEGSVLALGLLGAWVLARLFANDQTGLQWKRLALSAVPAFLAFAFQWGWKARHGFQNDLISSQSSSILDDLEGSVLALRLEELPGFFIRDWFLAPNAAAFLPPLVLALLLLNLRSLRNLEVALPALVCVLGTLAYLLVLVLTPYDFKWHWSTAAPRILGQLNPVLALLAACFLGDRESTLRSDS